MIFHLPDTHRYTSVQFHRRASSFWSIYFCNVLLVRVDERDYVIRA